MYAVSSMYYASRHYINAYIFRRGYLLLVTTVTRQRHSAAEFLLQSFFKHRSYVCRIKSSIVYL